MLSLILLFAALALVAGIATLPPAGNTAPTVVPISGYEGKAYIASDGETLEEFAQLRKWDLNIKPDMLDAATHASAAGGWKVKKPGMRDCTASIDMLLAAGDSSIEAILDAIFATPPTPVYLCFDPEGSTRGMPRRAGWFYLSYKESSPYNELAQVTCDAESAGPLAGGTVPLSATTALTASVAVTKTVQLGVNAATGDTVTWAVTGTGNGTVTEGLYTAPSEVPTPAEVSVTATVGTEVVTFTITVTAS